MGFFLDGEHYAGLRFFQRFGGVGGNGDCG
jgi:hypothetical protein